MRPVPAVARAVASLVLLSLMTAGCSDSTTGAEQPKSSPKPVRAADETVYYRCLEDHGIPLDTTDDGVLRVAKGKNNNAAILAAEQECVDLVPVLPSPDKEDMKRARTLSACLREHGVRGYPDPGPDGDPGLSNEMAHAMKTNPEYRKANRICDPRQSGGEDLSAGG